MDMCEEKSWLRSERLESKRLNREWTRINANRYTENDAEGCLDRGSDGFPERRYSHRKNSLPSFIRVHSRFVCKICVHSRLRSVRVLMPGGFTGSCTDLQLGRYEYQRSLPQRS